MIFIGAHWKYAVAAGLCVVCYAAGRYFRPMPVEVDRKTQIVDKKSQVADKVKDETKDSGPTRKVVLDFNPACPPSAAQVKAFQPQAGVVVPPIGVIRETIIDSGPVQVVERTTQEVRKQEDKQIQVVSVDKPLPEPPQWAVGTGLRLLPGMGLQLSVERRFWGPVWVTGWALEALDGRLAVPAVGVGLRVEF